MSEASHSALWIVVPMMTLNIGYAIYAWRKPDKVARRNCEFIESGEEAYFEQRRSWEAYGTTPETDPGHLKAHATRVIVLNGAALLVLLGLWWIR
jgi:hypothetical protein